MVEKQQITLAGDLPPWMVSLYVHHAGDANSGLLAQSAGGTPDNSDSAACV